VANTRHNIAAVGSRSPAKSAAVARRWGITTAGGSYEALVADPSLDVIYVATRTTCTTPTSFLALDAAGMSS
jgi:predicted dehydrogenase